MLRQDYFIRLIEEFVKALLKVTDIKDLDRRDHEIQDLYRQYVGPYEVVRNLSFDELITYAREQWPEEQRMDRLGFVAELLYAEADYSPNPLRAMLLDKTYRIYSYLDSHSGVMSIDRMHKMRKIESLIALPHDDHEAAPA